MRPVGQGPFRRASMDITVGAEEELQVVSSATGGLMPYLRGAQDDRPGPEGTTATEIHRCVIELQSRVSRDPDSLVAALARLRAGASRRAAVQGLRVVAAGLHPWSRWGDQPLHEETPHYAHLLVEYGDVARRALSFGLHVHLGLPDPAARMPVMNRLRAVLPEILALTASSPYFEGRDTGLQTWRHSLLGCYPRMGIPEVWESEEAYWAHVNRLRQTGCLEADRGLWEDLRLHHRYGTLEVRIADAVPSLDRVRLVVGLLQAEAATLIREWHTERLAPAWPRSCIEENKWRVRRRGLSARVVDWSMDTETPLAARLYAWAERLEPVAVAAGWGKSLFHGVEQALSEGTSADAQRAWRQEGGSWRNLVLRLADSTDASAQRWQARD